MKYDEQHQKILLCIRLAAQKNSQSPAMQHLIRNLLLVHHGLIMGDVHIQSELNPFMHNRAMATDKILLCIRLAALKNSQSPAMQHRNKNLLHVHQGPTIGDVHMQYD